VVIRDPFPELNCTERDRCWAEIERLSCRNGAEVDETRFAAAAGPG
jgi:hypothetical protein